MMIHIKRLSPLDDLNAALRTISEFNRIILAADTKAGLLLTANGFALTGLVTTAHTSMHVALVLMAIGLAVSLTVCMGYLAATLRPRLVGAGIENWFSFPAFPIGAEGRPAVPALADQAWQQAGALAEIAQRKYHRFGVALRWTAIILVAFLVWFTVTLLGSPA